MAPLKRYGWHLTCGLLATFLLGACGGSDETTQQPSRLPMALTATRVMEHFERETGLSLHKASELGAGPGIVMLGSRSLSIAPDGDLVAREDPVLTERFGEFSVVVYEDAEQAQAFSTGTPDQSDPTVVWREHAPESEGQKRLWSARKLYRNVELIWFSSQRLRDEKWAALDAILTSLPNE